MAKAKIEYMDGAAPHDSLAPPLTLPGYNMKRGKSFAAPRPAWGMVDANGRTVDNEQGRALLDEALRD